jgi:hypothetical protein
MNNKIYIARSPRIAARMLGEEMLVMSGQGSTLFTLNPTATALWEAADGATPLKEIVERRICTEFEVPTTEFCSFRKNRFQGNRLLRKRTPSRVRRHR